MHKLEEIFEREIGQFASRIFSQPERPTLDSSTETDLRVGLGGQERMFARMNLSAS